MQEVDFSKVEEQPGEYDEILKFSTRTPDGRVSRKKTNILLYNSYK